MLAIPFAGGFLPTVGGKLFHSKVTPIVFVFAAALASVGIVAFAMNGLTFRDAFLLAAPLYQVTLGTAAYAIFFHVEKRAPVDVAFNWKLAFFGDRVLAFVIVWFGVAGVVWTVAPPGK